MEASSCIAFSFKEQFETASSMAFLCSFGSVMAEGLHSPVPGLRALGDVAGVENLVGNAHYDDFLFFHMTYDIDLDCS